MCAGVAQRHRTPCSPVPPALRARPNTDQLLRAGLLQRRLVAQPGSDQCLHVGVFVLSQVFEAGVCLGKGPRSLAGSRRNLGRRLDATLSQFKCELVVRHQCAGVVKTHAVQQGALTGAYRLKVNRQLADIELDTRLAEHSHDHVHDCKLFLGEDRLQMLKDTPAQLVVVVGVGCDLLVEGWAFFQMPCRDTLHLVDSVPFNAKVKELSHCLERQRAQLMLQQGAAHAQRIAIQPGNAAIAEGQHAAIELRVV